MSKPIFSTGLRWLWLVVAVLIIDLGSKYLILQNFGAALIVLEGFLPSAANKKAA